MLRETASLPMAHASAAASMGGLAATRSGLCFQAGPLLGGISRGSGALPVCDSLQSAHRRGGGVVGRGLGRRRMVLAGVHMALYDPLVRSAKTLLHHGGDMTLAFLEDLVHLMPVAMAPLAGILAFSLVFTFIATVFAVAVRILMAGIGKFFPAITQAARKAWLPSGGTKQLRLGHAPASKRKPLAAWSKWMRVFWGLEPSPPALPPGTSRASGRTGSASKRGGGQRSVSPAYVSAPEPVTVFKELETRVAVPAGTSQSKLETRGVVPVGNPTTRAVGVPLPEVARGTQLTTLAPAPAEAFGKFADANEGAHEGLGGGVAAAAAWVMVTDGGQDGGKGMIVMRNEVTGTTMELPLQGLGVLFSACGTGVVSRCWGDGTIYERFSFRTGDSLVEATKVSKAKRVSDVPEGGQVGQWGFKIGESAVSLLAVDGDEEVHLLPDGFAFFGGGGRGILVKGSEEPEAMNAEKLRAGLSLPAAHTVTARVGRSAASVGGREGALRGRGDGGGKTQAQQDDIPDELICSITKEIMKDPWIAADGFSYERTALAAWLEKRGARSPRTGRQMTDVRMMPNNALRTLIAHMLEDA